MAGVPDRLRGQHQLSRRETSAEGPYPPRHRHQQHEHGGAAAGPSDHAGHHESPHSAAIRGQFRPGMASLLENPVHRLRGGGGCPPIHSAALDREEETGTTHASLHRDLAVPRAWEPIVCPSPRWAAIMDGAALSDRGAGARTEPSVRERRMGGPANDRTAGSPLGGDEETVCTRGRPREAAEMTARPADSKRGYQATDDLTRRAGFARSATTALRSIGPSEE